MQEEVYVSNIGILYHKLSDSIWGYRGTGHEKDAVYVRAFLPALLNAIASYWDSVLGKMGVPETDEILACKYANNRLKHNPKFASFAHESQGGFGFPMSFPFESPLPDIWWLRIPDEALTEPKDKHYNQQSAYQRLFEEKPVLITLEFVLESLGISYSEVASSV